MVFCAAINCSNNSKSGISTFKFPENAKLRKEWLIRMKRESFEPTKHSRLCAEHFTQDSFKQNLAVRSLLGTAFKPRRLNLKEDAVPTIFNFKSAEPKTKIGEKRSYSDTPKNGATFPHGNSNCVRSAFAKRRKLEVRISILFNKIRTTLNLFHGC